MKCRGEHFKNVSGVRSSKSYLWSYFCGHFYGYLYGHFKGDFKKMTLALSPRTKLKIRVATTTFLH